MLSDDAICSNPYCEHPFREHLKTARSGRSGYGPCMMAACPCQRFIKAEAIAGKTEPKSSPSDGFSSFRGWPQGHGCWRIDVERSGALIVTVMRSHPRDLKMIKVHADGKIEFITRPGGVRVLD
jgi:hypothetical protein